MKLSAQLIKFITLQQTNVLKNNNRALILYVLLIGHIGINSIFRVTLVLQINLILILPNYIAEHATQMRYLTSTQVYVNQRVIKVVSMVNIIQI